MTSGYFRQLLRRFGKTPEAVNAILEGTGVDVADIDDPAAEITFFQQLRQIDNIARLHGAGWAFQAAETWGATSHGIVGMAMLTAADLAEALKVFVELGHARAPFARRHLVRSRNKWVIELAPAWPLSPAQWRSLSEANFVGFNALISACLGARPEGLVFRFSGDEPAYAEQARAELGEGVAYGGDATFIEVPVDLLTLKLPGADPRLHGQMIDELKREIARQSNPGHLRYRVARLLATMPPGRTLDEASVARALAVSRRTLVRRLSDSGTTFRKLLDAELKARASEWLSAGNLSHAEIAERLGYADATSFSRARRRWFS